MPLKHGGLSHLADTAATLQGEDHYPVKRRGQKRRLNPNWTAIAWLEANQITETELEELPEYGRDVRDGVYSVRALGWFTAKRNGHYARPIFQLLPVDASSSNQINYADPCPACLDFSRSWACEEHHELEYDRRHGWLRPGRDEVVIHAPEEADPVVQRLADTVRRAFERSGGGAFSWGEPSDAQNSFWASNDFPYSAEVTPPADPNENRPGYSYNLASMRWEPAPRLVDRVTGASFPRFIEADRLRPQIDITAGPDDMARLVREGLVRRAEDLSFTADAFTLQVDGETVEGVRSFTINFQSEEGGDGR
jgi:hypothetical protein